MVFLVHFGKLFALVSFSKSEIALAEAARAISAFWKTHWCKLIPNWTRNRMITYTNWRGMQITSKNQWFGKLNVCKSGIPHGVRDGNLSFCSLKFIQKGIKTVASWLHVGHSSPDWAVHIQALAKEIVLCSWAGHVTLTVSGLSTWVYRCAGEFNARSNPAMD